MLISHGCAAIPPCLMKNRELMALPLHVMVVWWCPSMKNCESMALPLHVMVAWQCPSMKRVVVWQCPPTSLLLCSCVAMPLMSLHNHELMAMPLHVVVVWRCPPSSLLPINKPQEVPQDCLFALYCIIVNCILPKLLKNKCGIGWLSLQKSSVFKNRFCFPPIVGISLYGWTH